MKHKMIGISSLLLGTVIWGGAFVAQSAGMDLIGPFTFQGVRCLLAVIALFVTTLPQLRNPDLFVKKWTSPKLWISGSICGIALFAATSLQQVGLVDTDAGKAGFITAMYIVIVPLLGIFLRRMPAVNVWISVGIAIAGLYLLCGGVAQINTNYMLLIGCAAAFAVQITLIDRFASDLDPLRLNCIQALVVTVLSLIPAIVFEAPDMTLIVNCWLPLSYAGVLSMGAAYSLQIVGQKHLEPTTASLIMSLESVFAAISGAWLLGETMTGAEYTGCALVFIAVIFSQFTWKRKNKSTRL